VIGPQLVCEMPAAAHNKPSLVTVHQRNYRVPMLAPTSLFADYGCHVRILEEARILRQLGHHIIIAYHNGSPVADLDIGRTRSFPLRHDYEVRSSRQPDHPRCAARLEDAGVAGTREV